MWEREVVRTDGSHKYRPRDLRGGCYDQTIVIDNPLVMRWLIFIALLISAVTASPLFHDVEAGNLQYRDRMIETRSGERYLTNAERLKRGLPLNKPHVRATRTQGRYQGPHGRFSCPRSDTSSASGHSIAEPSGGPHRSVPRHCADEPGRISVIPRNHHEFPRGQRESTVREAVTNADEMQNIANARTFTLPNQGPSTSNTINTGLSDRPFLASAYGTGTAPTSAGGPNRLVSSGNK